MSNTTEQDDSAGPTGMANPASQYCEQVGGELEIRDEQNGQVGYCHLPDGRVVEEWALYRSSIQN
ncbi:putative hemolysin [Alcanivorax xiamenensis]|uniref:Hemolysin n=2 Tax=Alcanivorax xiamenensis TaxID=1177156 RepID=A0ABQ6YAH1_9GAMM|nr:DUF333 domain-containing protein [Alcanivorax sp. 24]KAF0806861.1 putative hemolysin [Alcanivorax xiamenensis]